MILALIVKQHAFKLLDYQAKAFKEKRENYSVAKREANLSELWSVTIGELKMPPSANAHPKGGNPRYGAEGDGDDFHDKMTHWMRPSQFDHGHTC